MSETTPMLYSNLGKAGIQVSRLSFGGWVTLSRQVNSISCYDLMKVAFEHGVNFFDNAEGYENGEAEVVMGEAIQQGIKEKVWDREDLVVSTKIFFGTKPRNAANKAKIVNSAGLSRKHIIEGTKASLRRMQLDYVDVLFCHRPDPVVTIEEVVHAMNFVINQGWAFYWGTSEWSSAELSAACEYAQRFGLIAPIVEQPEYSLVARQKVEVDFKRLYTQYGLGLTTWSPLASGVLTGKYFNGVPEGSRLSLPDYEWLKKSKLGLNAWQLEKARNLPPIAAEVGCSMSQLAIAWILLNKDVSTVILGATSIEQLKENLGALKFVDKLTPEIVAKIEEAMGTKPALDRVTEQVHRFRGLM